MQRSRLAFLASLTLLAAPLAACSSGGSDGSESTTAQETTTTAAAVEPLKILVSNDDGYSSEGIDALVEGLLTLDDVEVTVVAPLEQQSGTGGQETDGELASADVTLESGYEGTSVDGFPSDSIRVALDEQEVSADVVITGINEGQNLGPLVDLSGTVGAARAAVARDIPALATSQGLGDEFDFEAAVPLILEWVEENRDALLAGEAEVQVTSLNIPSCSAGQIRGLLEIEADFDGEGGDAVQRQDCDSTTAEADLTNDVEAFTAGYATITVLPATAAS